MNRRLLMGAATIGSAATLVTAASFASFNDTESVGPKTLNAGTLDLRTRDTLPLYFGSNLKPGDVRVFAFELENKGSLDGDLKMKIENIKDAENGINDVEDEVGDTANSAGELSKYVTIKVVELGGRLGIESVRTIYAGNLRDGLDKVSDVTGLRAREDRHYAVTLSFDKAPMTREIVNSCGPRFLNDHAATS
ncbi:MAG TPA: TasA family protein [Mycobacteriales bacterium]|nr:TasA family protein [Mycobacteriales bacterium]